MRVLFANDDDLDMLENESAATWTGENLNTTDFIKEKYDELEKFGLKKFARIYVISGDKMNEHYDLNFYPYDKSVNLLSIPLSDFEKLPTDTEGWLKLRKTGCRWFDDIVDNNQYSESQDDLEFAGEYE